MNSDHAPHNQSGNATIAALIILALMTVMGRVSSNTTMTELLISSNTRDYHKDFFISDGGVNLETQQVTAHPITLTIAEQRSHSPYYLVKSPGNHFTAINSNDTTTTNGTAHFIGSSEYKYAVKFVKRKQAMIKGEGARTVDLLYNEICTKIPDSAGICSQVFRQVTE